MAAALGPMIALTNRTPDQIPADVIVEQQQKAIEGKEVHNNTGSPAAHVEV